LSTDLGDIDFLGEVSGLGGFNSVKAASDLKNVGGVEVQVSSLARLIKSKTVAGSPRDLYVLPELKALEEVKKKPNEVNSSKCIADSMFSAGSLPAAHAHLS
jgi:hypothetical protein